MTNIPTGPRRNLFVNCGCDVLSGSPATCAIRLSDDFFSWGRPFRQRRIQTLPTVVRPVHAVDCQWISRSRGAAFQDSAALSWPRQAGGANRRGGAWRRIAHRFFSREVGGRWKSPASGGAKSCAARRCPLFLFERWVTKVLAPAL